MLLCLHDISSTQDDTAFFVDRVSPLEKES